MDTDKGRTRRQEDERTNDSNNENADERSDGRTDGRTDGRSISLTDGRTMCDGRSDHVGRTDGRSV